MNAVAASDTHIAIQPSILYVGTPVALITTRNADGTTNISPMSSVWALGDRLVLGVSSAAQGAINALRERELTLNFPDPSLWAAVEALGPTTGREDVPAYKVAMGYAYEPDKFACAGLSPQPGETVKPQRIAECPLQIETELLAAHAPTGEPGGFHIFEARALKVFAHPGVVIPGTQHVDTGRWSPLLYVFRHYFGTGPRLGHNFRAEA